MIDLWTIAKIIFVSVVVVWFLCWLFGPREKDNTLVAPNHVYPFINEDVPGYNTFEEVSPSPKHSFEKTNTQVRGEIRAERAAEEAEKANRTSSGPWSF
jgi:hypothetical protein